MVTKYILYEGFLNIFNLKWSVYEVLSMLSPDNFRLFTATCPLGGTIDWCGIYLTVEDSI